MQIDSLTLKAVNAILKKHNCKVVPGNKANTRWIVQRKATFAEQQLIGWPDSSPRPLYNTVQVERTRAVALAYGDALLNVLLDGTMLLGKYKAGTKVAGANGWYESEGAHDTMVYGAPVLAEHEVKALRAILA